MVFIYLLVAGFFIPSFAMDIPFEPLAPKVDWMPEFVPSEQAAKYKPLQQSFCTQKLTNIAPELPQEKKIVFVDCITHLRADHLDIPILKYILEDTDLMEAVIAYAPHYTRNGFIELFFAGSLLYEKVEAYTFFLKHHVYNTDIRLGGYSETPAEFIRRLNIEKN